MLPEIEDLLFRMAAQGDHIGPGGVSWDAHRDAERADNLDWIPHLVEELSRSKDKERRRLIYFILSHLGKNTRNEQIAGILLARVPHEKNYFVLMSMFEDFERLPPYEDCAPILPHLWDKRWQVASSAMDALHKCTSPIVEDALLEVLPSHTAPHIIAHGHAALGAVGTAKSIPYLCMQIHHPKEDVKFSAIHALGRLGDSSLTPIFLEALSDKSSGAKWVAMLALARHGDQSAVSRVLERTKAIVAKKRVREQLPKSELVAAIEYLNRHVHADPGIPKLFHDIKTRRWDNLFGSERQWLRAHVPAFGGPV